MAFVALAQRDGGQPVMVNPEHVIRLTWAGDNTIIDLIDGKQLGVVGDIEETAKRLSGFPELVESDA